VEPFSFVWKIPMTDEQMKNGNNICGKSGISHLFYGVIYGWYVVVIIQNKDDDE
jgi:hypothetical protein